ncbi:unnamed protein product, partial [marine sediment metagenome]
MIEMSEDERLLRGRKIRVKQIPFYSKTTVLL